MEFLIVWAVSVAIGVMIAEAKGRPLEGWVLSLFLGPLGVLVILALPNLVKQAEAARLAAERQKELTIQQEMLAELKALRAEKEVREKGDAAPSLERVSGPPPAPVQNPSLDEFIPENLRSSKRVQHR